VTTTTGHRARRGRVRGGAVAAAVAAIAAGAALAGCSSSSSSPSASAGSAAASAPAASSAPAVSLATSLSTPKDSWAIVPMSSNPTFWEVFVRPATSATWQLVTPPGVADNGGLVAAADTEGGLTVAVRPSQDLEFTPVSTTANAGANWSTDGPISQGVAASPDALAVSGRQLATVLDNGTVEASSDAGSSWRTLAKPGTIAASAAGQKCAAVHVSSVSFGPAGTQVLAAGECGATGAAGLFAYSAGDGWQRVSLPVSGPLVRLGAGTALVQAADGLTALWADDAPHWYAYAPLSASATPAPTSSAAWTASAALPVSNTVTASGGLAGATATSSGGTWVLLPGRQAATIGGPRQQWLLLPPTPAHTSVLASGPGTSIDALAVSGSTLTVWQLDRGSTVWARAQTISVPLQPGSSS
jgi:hypothetical protein